VAFPGERLSDLESKARAEAYLVALDGMPAWCVDRAVAWWLQGANGEGGENYAFAPSPPQLRRLAEKAALPERARRHRIDQLLKARIYTDPTPEMRAKVADLMSRFHRGQSTSEA
jgi:hypothetical protein